MFSTMRISVPVGCEDGVWAVAHLVKIHIIACQPLQVTSWLFDGFWNSSSSLEIHAEKTDMRRSVEIWCDAAANWSKAATVCCTKFAVNIGIYLFIDWLIYELIYFHCLARSTNSI